MQTCRDHAVNVFICTMGTLGIKYNTSFVSFFVELICKTRHSVSVEKFNNGLDCRKLIQLQEKKNIKYRPHSQYPFHLGLCHLFKLENTGVVPSAFPVWGWHFLNHYDMVCKASRLSGVGAALAYNKQLRHRVTGNPCTQWDRKE